MSTKKMVIVAFVVFAMVQWYFPVQMILQQEKVLKTGTLYKFKVAPIDPNDPFRGKYITLSYQENSFDITHGTDWEIEQKAYVLLKKDAEGYASIQNVTPNKPEQGDYVQATAFIAINNDTQQLILNYPFDRFYMEESKAVAAEYVYNQSVLDTNQIAYALVSVLDGEAVIKDVFIDDISIITIVKNQMESKTEKGQ